jgi:hypothetical protein
MLSKNDLAGRLLKLFAGNENHHGTHGEPQPRPGTLKMDITITAKTVMGPATLELWQTHLDPNETKPLGIIPICKDGLCWWGCIDIDKYDINLIQIIARIERVKLPLVCARSKSGGLRCYLFLSAPSPPPRSKRFCVLPPNVGPYGIANQLPLAPSCRRGPKAIGWRCRMARRSAARSGNRSG